MTDDRNIEKRTIGEGTWLLFGDAKAIGSGPSSARPAPEDAPEAELVTYQSVETGQIYALDDERESWALAEAGSRHLSHESQVEIVSEQQLFTAEGDPRDTIDFQSVSTDRITYPTVWVLAADMMNGGHPQVLGVYTTEAAAELHEQAIRDNGGCIKADGYDHPVASFWTYEMEVRETFPGLEEVGDD